MKYVIMRIFRIADVELKRELTTLEFDDVYEALEFCEFATTKQDKRAGIEYAACPILV